MSEEELTDALDCLTEISVVLRGIAALIDGLDKVKPFENLGGVAWILFDLADKSKKAKKNLEILFESHE